MSKVQYKHVFEEQDLSPEQRKIFVDKISSSFRSRPCRRVLFVSVSQIPEENFDWASARNGRYPCFPPYGLGILVRTLEENSFKADLIDLGFEIMAHAGEATTVDQFSFRIWQPLLEKKVNEFQPDLIGLSCMFNLGHFPLKETAAFLRKQFPHLPIIAGGVHPTLTAEILLEDIPEVDFVGLYESDKSFLEFLKVVNGEADTSRLAQIATRYENTTLKISKRTLPEKLEYSPDYKGLPIERYSQVGKIGAYTFLRDTNAIAATVLSTRGCRAACGFCSVRSVNGAGVRTRDYEQVVDEIERLKNTYGISHIMWLDDDLFYNSDRASEMFELLAQRKLSITWDASNGIIAAALNPRLLKACVDSGCVGFNIGIESGNPDMLRLMKKPGTVDGFRKAAKLLETAPEIFTKGFLVIGFPGETLAMMRDSVNLAVEMALDWYPIQILTPMPGTPIFQMMADQGLLGDIPTVVFGKARTFSVGATGTIGRRERLEKEKAKRFEDLFSGDLSQVPSREVLEDLWFTIDYKINYECIFAQSDPKKLYKKRSMLREICYRMTVENALGFLFLGITEFKLGNATEALDLIRMAKRFRESSDFWRKRFESLGIDAKVDQFVTGCDPGLIDPSAIEGMRTTPFQNKTT